MGDARYGRRHNGLHARAYAAAGDVDPRVGEHLLDVLARDGIAAYLRPSSDLHPVTRSSTLPERPTDRLYVDRDHIGTARDHLARLAREEREAEAADRTDGTDGGTAADHGEPADRSLEAVRGEHPAGRRRGRAEPTSDEVERAFAEIVAGFGQTAPPEPGWHPSLEGQRTGTDHRRTGDEEPSLLDGLDTFGAGLPDDEAEGFVPPEPPPLPRPSLPTALAVIGVIGGLVVFLKPGLLPFVSPSLAMFVGFTAVVTGFGTLVWRMRPSDEDDAGTDDGARV